MITKAYKNYCQVMLLTKYKDVATYGLLAKSANGQNLYIVPGKRQNSVFPYSMSANIVTNTGSMGFVVGSGGTAATENDYALESQLTTISGTAAEVNITNKDGKPAVVWNLPVKNTGSSDITVREVGIQATLPCATTQGNTPTIGYFVLDRTVLSSPVTIAPNETKNILYSLVVG